MSSSAKALLAILAHPDDESFGPGGTLAKYAAQGVDVHIAIATDGAAGSVVKGHEEKRAELAAVRSVELDEAVRILGGTLHRLGYRDSGMKGDEANDHPEAFIRSDLDEAVGRVVRLIREIRPQVVLTHDETGGYFHPDHIRCWEVTTAAFEAAGNPEKYPEQNLPPYQPERLYYTAFPKRYVNIGIALMRLTRKDPTKAGLNGDIDLTKLGMPNEKINARIDIRNYWQVKKEASAAHATQGGGGMLTSLLPDWFLRQLLGRELFMRAYPPLQPGEREQDLFGANGS